MSLVDYASSDEEDAEISEKQPTDDVVRPPPPQTPTPSVSRNQSSEDKEQKTASLIPATTIEKLPDASLLLSSPILPYSAGNNADHFSRVATAVAVNAFRKREANGSTTPGVRAKVPRGSVPHSKNIPETNGAQLIPPQLRGRSNVVTEDIGKLFVKKTGAELKDGSA